MKNYIQFCEFKSSLSVPLSVCNLHPHNIAQNKCMQANLGLNFTLFLQSYVRNNLGNIDSFRY